MLTQAQANKIKSIGDTSLESFADSGFEKIFLKDMEQLLAGQDWLAGARFSLADAAMAPYIQTLYYFGWADWYLSRPKVAVWYDRCVKRASYQSGVADDFSAQTLAELNSRGQDPWRKIQQHLGAV